MAPPRVVAATVSGGFTAIPVRFSVRSRVSRHLFVKPHRVREAADRRRPQDRTLFVLNLPPYITQECVHRLFSQCGPVTSVELQEKPGTVSISEKQKSKFFSGPPAQSFRVAYVVFKKPAGMKAAVSSKCREPWVLSPRDHPIRTGLQKWIQGYCCSIVNPSELQTEVDQFMKEHDEKAAELEAQAASEDGVPDEDGWVKVTRKGRRPGIPRTETGNLRLIQREKRKRARKELLNFYSWQHRETKREHIAQLRKKFEEDKQRVALLRAERKFKPY